MTNRALAVQAPRRTLITGGSRGIGLAAAKLLAASGAHLVLLARDLDHLVSASDVLGKLGGHVTHYQVDLQDQSSVDRVSAQVLGVGPIHVLINCAGSLTQGLMLAQSTTAMQAEMEVNYWGAVRTIRAFLPAMMERREGRIINVSSMLGAVGTATTANYGASKAALEAFTAALRNEVRHHGVQASLFVAPHTQTELGHRADFRGLASVPVDVVGRALVESIGSSQDTFCAGRHLAIGRTLARWLPGYMERNLNERVRHLLG